MGNVIAIIIILVILTIAIGIIIREKQKGAKCIGCPYSKQCGSDKCHR